MQEVFTVDETICQQLLSAGLAPDAVEASLRAKGIDAENIAAYVNAIKRIRCARRRSTGFACMATGAFLGFLSCVLTITHAVPEMFALIFYGLTMLAVCLVILGLYYVFE